MGKEDDTKHRARYAPTASKQGREVAFFLAHALRLQTTTASLGHFSAHFRAPAACLGARLAMVVLVLAAFVAACLADVCAQLANGTRVLQI